MGHDLISELGTLAFASRLKRLADRLQRDVSRVYEAQKVNFRARWFPMAILLSRSSPMSITAIANSLKFTHAAVNQIATEMTRHGLLVSRKDKSDERRRLLALSRRGRDTVVGLQPLWLSIERCTEKVIAESGQDAFALLRSIESALDEREMYDRIITDFRGRIK